MKFKNVQLVLGLKCMVHIGTHISLKMIIAKIQCMPHIWDSYFSENYYSENTAGHSMQSSMSKLASFPSLPIWNEIADTELLLCPLSSMPIT